MRWWVVIIAGLLAVAMVVGAVASAQPPPQRVLPVATYRLFDPSTAAHVVVLAAPVRL